MPHTDTNAATNAAIDADAQSTVDLLLRLCRQPSISAQRIGLPEMATLVQTVLEETGFEARQEPTNTGVPLVYGELRAPGATRTLLIYNHYDVQPPEPLEKWTTPPFEPTIRDGRVFARGATDNKGNIASRIAAIRALRATHGALPINLKYIIEGEEEISSPGMPDFLAAHTELLSADGCLWEDTMGRVDAPIVSLGNKGMCKVEFRARVAAVDSHSAYAGVYPNAIWRLVWALATLKDQNERVLIPGFYDAIRPYSPSEQRVVDALPPLSGENLRQVRGIDRLVSNLQDHEIHRRQSTEPTCNISGIEGGYVGAGSKTVIPATARARIDMRLVADQDPQHIETLLREHLVHQGFDDIEVIALGHSHPSRTAVDTPLNRAIMAASRAVYGKDAIIEPHQAGSTPQWVIERFLGMPCSATGVGYVTSMTHAPTRTSASTSSSKAPNTWPPSSKNSPAPSHKTTSPPRRHPRPRRLHRHPRPPRKPRPLLLVLPRHPLGRLRPRLHLHGFLGVDIFLVLSGYILARKYHQVRLGAPYKAFLIKRIARVYPFSSSPPSPSSPSGPSNPATSNPTGPSRCSPNPPASSPPTSSPSKLGASPPA